MVNQIGEVSLVRYNSGWFVKCGCIDNLYYVAINLYNH